MENGKSKVKYPVFCHWDVDKYKPNYPPEHWELCRLFMFAHKTKYPEARLVQLTEAFFNMGVYSRGSDPKTDRLVAALSVPVIEHILHFHPESLSHPFKQQSENDVIDIEQEDARSGDPGAHKPESSLQSLNPLENRQYSPKGNKDSSGCHLQSPDNGSHTAGLEQPSEREQDCKERERDSKEQERDSKEHGQTVAGQKRVSPEERAGSEKSEHSDSKRRRLSPENERLFSRKHSVLKKDVYYKLKKLLDRDAMKRLLLGFVIIRDVGKDSTVNDDLSTLEDSFNRSKFGPHTWHIKLIDKDKDIKRIRLQLGDEVLVEAEGKVKEVVKLKIAEAFLNRVSAFSPLIKATYTYYNDGKCKELPPEAPTGYCWHFLNHYTLNSLKSIIDDYEQRKPFWEMIVQYYADSPNEFRLEDLIRFIENEKVGKLSYRLAEYTHESKKLPAICISYIHSGVEWLEWLEKNEDQRYRVVCDKTCKREFWRFVEQKESSTNSVNKKEEKRDSRKQDDTTRKQDVNDTIKKENAHDITKKENVSNTTRKQNDNDSNRKQKDNNANRNTETIKGSSGDKRTLQEKVSRTENLQAKVTNNKSGSQPPFHREELRTKNSTGEGVQLLKEEVGSRAGTLMPSFPTPKINVNVGRQEKNEVLWVGKEHLPALAKSIYLVKMVKEDSTTEDDPFKLLKSICSLEYNIEIKFSMKQLGDKTWHVLVVMKYDTKHILVGEGKAITCTDARLAAAHDAVNSIQANCRVVEPNFKYFAGGGVPTFISLKNPIKTSTYEIMIIDTIKNPFTQEIVDLLLGMFIEDKSIEDLFFLGSDYTCEERELVIKSSTHHGLGCRLFGQRNRLATGDSAVSTQNVCVFRPKTPVELVQQVIVSGGSSDKYSIVTKNTKTTSLPGVGNPVAVKSSVPALGPALTRAPAITPATAPTPAPARAPAPTLASATIPKELWRVCYNEKLPGGCVDPVCLYVHRHILDNVVNQFFGIRQ